jgi:putative peptidoglycan lipid II flippase
LTAVPEKYAVAEPPSTPGLVAVDASTARSSVVVSASVVLVSAFGGALAVLIALIAGEGPRTDGFLAAYAAYLTLILFGSTLRVALVPLLGPTGDEAEFRATAATSVARLIAASALVCAVLGCLSPLLGRALVPGAPADAQFTAAVSVAVLALAAWAQIWAAALSAVLSASRRFASSAVLYSASSAITVALAAALLIPFGVLGAAFGLLASAAALLAGHVVYLRRFRFAVRPAWSAVTSGATWRLVGRALAGAAVPISLQINLSIALAAVSHQSGAVTGYTYAYFVAVTISGITSATIGLTTMPQLVQSLSERGRAVADEYVARVAPFSLFLYVPAAAGYACLAHPILVAVLDGPLSASTVALLWDASRIFLLMALTWAVLLPMTGLALSLKLFGGLSLISVACVVVQVGLMVVLGGKAPLSVAIAHAANGVLLVVLVVVLVFGARAGAATMHALRASFPAFPLALVFPALALAGFNDAVFSALAGLVLGGALYLGLAVWLWPAVGRHAVRLLLGR